MLSFGFWRRETHRWAVGCFADCFGIGEVVLVVLNDGLDELGRDELDLMADSQQLPRHPVCAGAGFRHHRSGLEVGEKRDQALAIKLPVQQRIAVPILSMHMKAVLA